MNKILLILFLSLSFNCFSQSQTEMNLEAGSEFDKAETEMNRIYQQILTEYKKDIVFVENLKKSQRIWIEFRDAEMEMKFPKRERGYYGSVLPLCRAIYLKKLTEKRTESLNVWLLGIVEGDACNGSVKTN